MPLVRRPTFSLYYDDLGPRDAPAIVLMPGFLFDGSIFEHMATALARRFRVLNVDLRGHGRSTTPSRGWTLEDQADDVAALLDHAGVASAIVGGLSQGGMTALRVALYHPTRVRALVLLNTSASPEVTSVRMQYAALTVIYRAVGLIPLVESAALERMFSDHFRRQSPDVVERHVSAWRKLDRLGVARSMQAIASRGDLGNLEAIRVPTLVITGDADRALSPELSQRIVRSIEGAKLVCLAGSGHMSTIEQPEATTNAVLEFVDTLS